MSFLFGGSKSKQQSTSNSTSSSYNQAYPYIQQAYQPTVATGNSAFSSLGALLGLGGNKEQADSAYNNYLGSTDYSRTLRTGTQAITNNGAVNGLLGSGKTLKALNSYGQETAQKYFGDYLSRLLGLGNAGLNAGQLIMSAGNTASSQSAGQSSGTSGSNNGAASTIGSIASLVALSDRKAKKDIVKLGSLDDGLGVYEWTYIGGGPRHRGHMADEVERLRPWALGPIVNGYQTVDYAKINEAA